MNRKKLCIIGGGPAGVSAGVYAARKEIDTVFFAEEFGGQSSVSADIQNWIGTPSLSGVDLAEQFEKHLRSYEGEKMEIHTSAVTEIQDLSGKGFLITDTKGYSVEADALFFSTGATRRKLSVSGADRLEHKGLTYCASCDGPFFKNKDVVVVGGGNAGFETALQLLAYTTSVTLLHRGDAFKADATTVKKVCDHPHMKAYLNADIQEVSGSEFVEKVRYSVNGKEIEQNVQGVFVEIGNVPATSLLEHIVDMDEYKRIIVDPKTQKTSHNHIWAAGDCTNALYHQNNIASGDGVKALENIYISL